MAKKFNYSKAVYDKKTDFPTTGDVDTIYIDASQNKAYRYDVNYFDIGSAEVDIWGAMGSLSKGGGGGGGASWGSINGTLSNQTDLNTALSAKQDALTLTTTGSSGAATLVGSTLNIPQYSTTLNPSIISLSAVSATAVTGTTANSIASAILIPANTFGSTGIIDIMGRYQKTGTAGTQNLRLYVNTSASLTGATLVANFYSGANINAGAWRTANIFSNTINFYSLTGATNSDLGTNTGTPATATFNTSVNNYIIFAVQLSNGSDSSVLQYHKVMKYV